MKLIINRMKIETNVVLVLNMDDGCVYIINTSYQKLPVGSGDYPDKISSYLYVHVQK